MNLRLRFSRKAYLVSAAISLAGSLLLFWWAFMLMMASFSRGTYQDFVTLTHVMQFWNPPAAHLFLNRSSGPEPSPLAYALGWSQVVGVVFGFIFGIRLRTGR
jgi:hypothetical protein